MTKRKDSRKLKVHGSSGYNYRETPLIMLKGLWLREFGFDSNTPIEVKCENGKLAPDRSIFVQKKSGRDQVPTRFRTLIVPFLKKYLNTESMIYKAENTKTTGFSG